MRRSPAALLTELRRTPGKAFIAFGVLIALAITPAIFDPRLYDDFTLPKQATLLFASASILIGFALEGSFLPRQPVIRWMIVVWTLLAVLSFAAAVDRRGSILGYYQYRQGLLTQVAYIALFLGAVNLARSGDVRWMAWAGALGIAPAFVYTAFQSLNADPFEWWVDTSVQAFGTIGNANELAAYAVLALAFCGVAAAWKGRWRATTLPLAAAVCFIVLQSESRSGLIALALVALVYPAASLALGIRRSIWAKNGLIAATGLALGVVLSLGAGGVSGTASRVHTGLEGSDNDGITRVALWEGTLPVIAASPLLGSGPDSLYLEFSKHRPDDLGGAFHEYDLTVQSSHNLLLDVAANQGLPALATLVGLLVTVALVSFRLVRRKRDDEQAPFIAAAIVGYLALTMLNPVSLAAHAIFFVVLGTLAGRAEPTTATTDRTIRVPLRLVMVAPGAACLVGIAVLLPIADRRADDGWEAHARGEFVRGAETYANAGSLLPFERSYARHEAEDWLAAGVAPNEDALTKAKAAYEDFDERFGLSSTEALGLVAARIGLGDTSEIDKLVDRALALSPYAVLRQPPRASGLPMREYTDRLHRAALVGGTLRYSETDRWLKHPWVYVVLLDAASAR
ncbi:MAG: O-antigen ligase family protein [Anaerolineaceae bacterium]